MGKKRRAEEVVEPSKTAIKDEDDDSDMSLILPEVVFDGVGDEIPKKRRKEKLPIPTALVEENIEESVITRESPVDDTVADLQTTVDHTNGNTPRFSLFLIRKPIELSAEDLTDADVPLNKRTKESKMAIGGKVYCVNGSKPSTQMFHIPTEVVQSAQKSRFNGIDSPITGTILITRAEFDKPEEDTKDGDVKPFDDLPLKAIKRKPSKKSFSNLQQRLKANGVKQG
ncbi:hypothetical protein Q1695_011298 [Nippostrongylus brasiliensis]|nr:hypothetical protein Q1695_011298 [Nippostrongylus brasiliensis]